MNIYVHRARLSVSEIIAIVISLAVQLVAILTARTLPISRATNLVLVTP